MALTIVFGTVHKNHSLNLKDFSLVNTRIAQFIEVFIYIYMYPPV